MYKAAILTSDFENPAATAKEIQDYLKKSGKLLYGNDKRKTKNTPFINKINSVMHAFNTFEELITGEEKKYYKFKTLYVFDDQVNEIHFFLKYADRIAAHFLLDDKVIHEMHKCEWSYGHLTRYKDYLQNNAGLIDFMAKNGIGNVNLYKAAPKFTKATDAYISKIDDAIRELEEQAMSLFKTGW